MHDFLLGWVGLILGFSGLIFIHELGHFVLAKWNGVRVYVFSLGMGPYLLSFTWRGTCYALSMIPIGGYVKMMGQDDLNPSQTESKDREDYRNKRPGQKAAILAAGACFNLIFTLLGFTLCYRLGMHVEPPKIGNISPDRPLSKATMFDSHGKKVDANLHKGDTILEVGETPVKTYFEAAVQFSGAPKGEPLVLKVERTSQIHPSNPAVDMVYVLPSEDKRVGATGIGLEHYQEILDFPLGFRTDDTIVVEMASEMPERKREEDIKKFREAPAGQAGLDYGDEFVRVADLNDPAKPVVVEIKDFSDLTNFVRGSGGHKLTFTVRRNGDEIAKTVTPFFNAKDDVYQIGAPLGLKRVVADIDPNSDAYQAGLRQGQYVLKFDPKFDMDDVNLRKWTTGKLVWLKEWKDRYDEKDESTAVLNFSGSDNAKPGLVYTETRSATYFYRAESIWEALHAAWDDTGRFALSVFGIIAGLFKGDVSISALSGPVGIGSAMHQVASTQTFINFFWFLGFISLNLGVMQFIPIPLLDGWHLVMVAIEKLKGRPVAPKVQEAFQYVGLFLVGGLLLLATYQDIRRFIIGS